MNYRYLLGIPTAILLKIIPVGNDGICKCVTDPVHNCHRNALVVPAAGSFWLNSYGDTVCRGGVPVDLPAGHYTIHTYAPDGSCTVALLVLAQPFAVPGDRLDRAIAAHSAHPMNVSHEEAVRPTRQENPGLMYSCGERVSVPNTSPDCPQGSVW